MKQKELIDRYAGMFGTTKKVAKEQIDQVARLFAEMLQNEGEVRHQFLGTLKTVVTPAATRRNPATQEPVEVPEKTRVRFKASQALKRAVNGGDLEVPRVPKK